MKVQIEGERVILRRPVDDDAFYFHAGIMSQTLWLNVDLPKKLL